MRRFLAFPMNIAAGIAILATLLFSPGASADPLAAPEGHFLLSVFDCFMPVPDSLILNTRTEGRTDLVSPSSSPPIQIVVESYAARLDPHFTVLKTRKIGDLNVQELRNAVGADLPATRIYDGNQQVMIFGGSRALVESMIQGCVQRRVKGASGD